MKCLFVIDMQNDYVGENRNKKRYRYDEKILIQKINSRIQTSSNDIVVYITNRFFWESKISSKEFVRGLEISSTHKYEKRKSSSFSNKELLLFLQNNHVDTIELVGVDGNYCVAATALDGVKKGFSVICNESCIGISNPKKFERTKKILLKEGVQFL